ncbi:ribosomal-processing cysteine protease Prp [bacterium]|nr:ribosomal-processing cysteine protease Prp [bacterium]MBU1599365.1 ribosomal-processing cysteine protease Prp [bacterium]
MVRIRIERKSGKIVSFSAEGHSDYKRKGEDIVCAGVSSILQTAVLGLKDYLKADVELIKETAKMMVKLKNSPTAESQIILETMLLGLHEIEREYPAKVKIEEV